MTITRSHHLDPSTLDFDQATPTFNAFCMDCNNNSDLRYIATVSRTTSSRVSTGSHQRKKHEA